MRKLRLVSPLEVVDKAIEIGPPSSLTINRVMDGSWVVWADFAGHRRPFRFTLSEIDQSHLLRLAEVATREFAWHCCAREFPQNKKGLAR